MTLHEIHSLISQLPRQEKEELLLTLARELRHISPQMTAPLSLQSKAIDREEWVRKLEQLQSLTSGKNLRPSQEILDEIRADRI